MTSEQFAYWLQGFSELNGAPPTAEQWQSIREHLALVFNKQTPPLKNWPVQYPPAASPNYPGQAGYIVPQGAAVIC